MGYYPNGGAPNYSFANGHHYGIDYATPYGTLITAPTSGTVSRQYNQYGGLIARLVSGIYAQYFLHLSEVLKLDVLNKENQLLELVIVDSGQLGHIFTIKLSHLLAQNLLIETLLILQSFYQNMLAVVVVQNMQENQY